MKKVKLSVIIPVFNEEKTLDKILARVLKRKEVYEVIVVDDGSTDRSVNIVKNFKNKRIKLLGYRKNQGKGFAIRLGIKKACGDYIVIQDADLEYNPADFPKLLGPILAGKADFVLGNRWNSKKGYLLAQLGNWYISALTNILFNLRLSDSYTCYKIGSKDLWQSLNLKSTGFEIEAEVVSKLAIKKVRLGEVLISYDPRTFAQGKKIKWKDVLKGTQKLIKVRLGKD